LRDIGGYLTLVAAKCSVIREIPVEVSMRLGYFGAVYRCACKRFVSMARLFGTLILGRYAASARRAVLNVEPPNKRQGNSWNQQSNHFIRI
jgi:hypothetical protein